MINNNNSTNSTILGQSTQAIPSFFFLLLFTLPSYHTMIKKLKVLNTENYKNKLLIAMKLRKENW